MWNRKLWGVEFTGADGRKTLIGASWHLAARRPGYYYPGEPSRALLFCNRRQAREWCVAKERMYADSTYSIATWRFRAVRVIETVKRV